MAEKKYKKEYLRDQISKVYESVEKYAEEKGVTPQAIYEKTKTQSRKFLKELEDDGVYIIKEVYSIERFNNLEKEVKELKDLVIQLTKDNSNLREENWRLRVLCAQSGGVDPESKKIKG